MTTVARKKGTQTYEDTHIHTHIDSIHSPHKTLNTIMKLCMKSTKFQRGSSLFRNLSMLSEKQKLNARFKYTYFCCFWFDLLEQIFMYYVICGLTFVAFAK